MKIREPYWFALVVIGFVLLVVFGHEQIDYYHWSEALP